MRWLWPTTTPGAPGRVTPATARPGACRWAMYQMPGREYSRCMSLERIGLPEAVRLPARAHEFEPGTILSKLRSSIQKLAKLSSVAAEANIAKYQAVRRTRIGRDLIELPLHEHLPGA